MESFKIENVSFSYPNRRYKALENINLTVKEGEFVLLCGKSGCGKTTLLRMLKSSLSPFGELCGNIYFKGEELSSYDKREQASKIGFVMQSPDNQIVTDKVWHEIAFGLESLGYKQSEIRMRVSEMASFFGIDTYFHKNTNELSGGQKQLLNLASVMAMEPDVLILDEPTSQLDPISANDFFKTLEKINREMGTTVILTEHRLQEVFAIADRVIVMDEGKIIADEVPRKTGEILKEINHDMYKALPTGMRVHGEVKNSLRCPLTVREGREWLREYGKTNTLNPDLIPKDEINPNAKSTVVEIKEAYFRYEKNSPDVIKGLSMKVQRGELFCILGGNGTGKTTLLSLISLLNKPYRGEVILKGQNISKIKNLYNGLLGYLPQNPQSLFVKKTVYLDLMDMLDDKSMTKEEKEQKLQSIASLCRIDTLLNSHPYDLSGGEQKRLALCKILLTEPELLLLDEPTWGMDAHFKEEFAEILTDLKSAGTTVIMVSHDIEFCAKNADRCALVFDGSITSIGTAREFFKGNNFYTTSANRMARAYLPNAVLAEDIILACGGTVENKERKPNEPKINKPEIKTEASNKKEKRIKVAELSKSDRKLTKRTCVAALLMLLLIPLTIFAGIFFLGDRKYYFISLLIILETMIPFLMVFESRKPKAREIIIISVLCAIAVGGRAVFFMLPHFKPVVAIVIITGICFGAEAGFLVGATTGFVSGFLFGQGPWTPWQMFAFGIIGFIGGILFKKGFLIKTKTSLCIFGFLATFIIYGGIMNPASVIMWQTEITWEMLASAYIVGFPLDLIHSVSSAFFLWILAEPMIDKLERIKIKYGLIEG